MFAHFLPVLLLAASFAEAQIPPSIPGDAAIANNALAHAVGLIHGSGLPLQGLPANHALQQGLNQGLIPRGNSAVANAALVNAVGMLQGSGVPLSGLPVNQGVPNLGALQGQYPPAGFGGGNPLGGVGALNYPGSYLGPHPGLLGGLGNTLGGEAGILGGVGGLIRGITGGVTQGGLGGLGGPGGLGGGFHG
uniref:Glycine-rich cell wall structural protein n=1 Tax=Steinernema glaseri TaxID=37863 RepID=A0A1I8A0J8_9BILA